MRFGLGQGLLSASSAFTFLSSEGLARSWYRAALRVYAAVLEVSSKGVAVWWSPKWYLLCLDRRTRPIVLHVPV